MLTRLQVRNFVLIDSLDIQFPEGLIIVTGQTGAGKSIILGALSLVMGAKADAGMLSDGADSCVVEAEFEVADRSGLLRSILCENDIEFEDGNLILRRVVSRSGRSRAFINDFPVQVSVMQAVSSRLIDIHSQHQTLLLSDKLFQMSVLDHYAGNEKLVDLCATAWRELNHIKASIRDLDEQIAVSERDKEYNEAQYAKLEAASLRIGELAELEEEQKQLANAEEIKASLCAVEAIFDDSASGDGISIDASLKDASRQLAKVARYIPAASVISDRLDSCRLELEDILSEVSSLNSGTQLSQSRLQEVEERMSLIYGLMHKHLCSDESELISLRDKLGETICDSTLLVEKRSALEAAMRSAESVYRDAAGKLHEKRAAAADSFALCIQESIHSLELPYAVFKVVLSESEPGLYGSDSVAFLFSANGLTPVDVSKCASGGELSRIMLSLKAMMARYAEMPTLVFDEIDTGVSGSVADKIGSMICTMGENMQVFAITHLPQVAAKGNAHYLVSKVVNPEEGRAVSTITRLDDRERVMELARMLSGSVLTEAAVANAESLLKG